MYSFKKSYVNTNEAEELKHNLSNNKKQNKKVKELLEEFDVIYIVEDGKGINDYEVIKIADFNSILILNRNEFEEITSKKPLKRIVDTKLVYDLRRS